MARSSTRPQSGTRVTRSGTGRIGIERFPSLRGGAWFGLLVAVLVLLIGIGGRPVRLRPGTTAPFDVTAKVAFSYLDEEQQRLRQEAAERSVPSRYEEDRQWADKVLEGLRRLVKTVRDASSDESLAAVLAEMGAVEEAKPLIALRKERGPGALDRLLELVRAVLSDLGRIGVLDETRFAEEEMSGRAAIAEVDETGRLRILSLGKEAVALEEARRLLVSKLDAALADFPPDVVKVVKGRLIRKLSPNLRYSSALTNSARAEAARKIPPIRTKVAAGEIIVRKGEEVDSATYRKLRKAQEAARLAEGITVKLERWGGYVVIVTIVLVPMVLIIRLSEAGRPLSSRRITSLCLGGVGVVAASKVLAMYLFTPGLSPITLMGLACGLVFSLGTAFAVTVALALLSAAAMGEGAGFVLAMTAGTLGGVLSIRDVSRRSGVLSTGALTGGLVMMGLMAWEFAFGNKGLVPVAAGASYGLLNGLISGAVLAGLMPVLEYAFDTTTRISLLELSDQDHPALRDLLVRAPGTYHHSLILGNIAEACARAIGADALLTRVASYYHDIGKMNKPEYFVENQPPGRSPHEVLSPSMSALVIISHVKDGVDLASEYGLPRVIRDVIEQHHGTTLVEFFYRRALEGQEEAKGRISQRLFRYPGPLPQTKEAALVMLADSVEAASRSLEEPSPAHIDNLVAGIIQRRLLDGQLDESNLTFRDLKKIRETMVRALGSMYHSRPRYPGQDTPGGS